jgi:uncharacterized protein YcbX
MPTLTRITLFPIKSLDGVRVDVAGVRSSGALAGDRRWAIVDGDGKYINGKRTAAIHGIRATYAKDLAAVSLASSRGSATFRLPEEAEAIGGWLGAEIGLECRLIENEITGFPDDLESPGPTLVSTTSLAAVRQWFDGLDEAEVRRRFRANLEIDAAAPFWEDQLAAGAPGGAAGFAVGIVQFRGTTICQRCAVPTRDSRSGEAIPGFARRFGERRQSELPDWAPRERFDHFYRLMINTQLVSLGDEGMLHVGDAVRLIR